MMQLELPEIQKIFPYVPDGARVHRWPSVGIQSLASVTWAAVGGDRRVFLHTARAAWRGGMFAAHPERGYPLYRRDDWRKPEDDLWSERQQVYLVATEREADSLTSMGLYATTWIMCEERSMKMADWGALDGIGVAIWLPERLAKAATAHLWRYRIVPASAGAPINWLRTKWEEFGGDRQKIKDAALWMKLY